MEVQLKLWKSNKCATLPTCNSLLQVPFCFGCLKMQEQRFPKYWFSFTCLMPWLFHYCTHEGRSQHSVADMRVHCSILVTTCPWKICPYNANMQRPLFLQTYLFPESACEGFFVKKQPLYYIFTASHLLI